jgi:peptidyl-prolyl cis-trans isomerase SurA
MKRLVRSASALSVLAAALALGPAAAQDGPTTQRAAAVVNDLVISTFDVDQRTRLVLSRGGGPQSEQARQRIRSQVLRTLIDELLQLQEAEKSELEVSEKEVDEALGRIAEQNGTTPAAVINQLAREGIYASTLKTQIKAEIAWSQLIEARLAPRINLTDEEIDEEMRRIEAGATKAQYLISEIFLSIEQPGDESRAQSQLNQIYSLLQSGTPFPTLAEQFSDSATRQRGGDAGWVTEGDVAPEVMAVLSRMRPQSMSDAIRVPGGLYLVILRDKMRPAGSAAEAPPVPPGPPPGVPAGSVKIKRVIFGVPPNMTKQMEQQVAESVMRLRGAIRGCQGLEETMAQLQGVLVQDLPVIPRRDLSPGFQQVLQGLSYSDTTLPFFTEEAPGQIVMNMLVLCGDRPKEEYIPTQAFQMPEREDIANGMFREELANMARRYMRDLRRDASIEIYDGNPDAVRGQQANAN